MEAAIAAVDIPRMATANVTTDNSHLDEHETGYQNAFSRLASATQHDQDSEVKHADMKALLSTELAKSSARRPGIMPQLLAQVTNEKRESLLSYMTAHSVTIQ